jgi:uncharacterized membrane protein
MTPNHALVPPSLDYNPSSWRRRIPVILLALLGFAVATYMGLYQWRLIDDVFDPVFGEQTKLVLDSDVSHSMQGWFGIPDAVLGAFAYLGDAVLCLAGSTRRWKTRPWIVALFGIDVILVGGVSVILIILQGTVVGSWCFLCLVSALISVALIMLAYAEVWVSLKFLRRVWQRSESMKVLWNVFWGRRHPVADEVALQGSSC